MDPTRAIEGILDNLGLTAGMPIQEFLSQLAEFLPMLDGGAYRQQVEPMISADNWQPLEKHMISASLSQALLRLELTMQLVFSSRSDDLDAMVLDFFDNMTKSAYCHPCSSLELEGKIKVYQHMLEKITSLAGT